MLHETLLQGQIFLCMLYFGLWCGIIFELKNIIEKTFFNNKIVCLILDICFMTISSIIFILGKNISNFGEFRGFLLLGFGLGAIIEHFSIGFLVEKIFNLIYNTIAKLLSNIIEHIQKFVLKQRKKSEKKAEQRLKNKQQKSAKSTSKKSIKKGKKKNEHKSLEVDKVYST